MRDIGQSDGAGIDQLEVGEIVLVVAEVFEL